MNRICGCYLAVVTRLILDALVHPENLLTAAFSKLDYHICVIRTPWTVQTLYHLIKFNKF